MILRTGVDLIEISRIEEVVQRHGSHYLERVYTSAEIEYCGKRAESLAGRFAAKEACLKLFPRETALETIAASDFSVEREGDRRLGEAPSVCSTPFPEPAAAPAKTRSTSGIADGCGLWDRKGLPVAAMAWMPPAPYRVTGRALHSHFVLFGDLDISGDRLPPGFVVLHDPRSIFTNCRFDTSALTDARNAHMETQGKGEWVE